MWSGAGVVMVVAAGTLAGCLGGDDGLASLNLDHLDAAPSAPFLPVNLTAQDRQVHPVLDRLLARWEAGDGQYAGFSEAYPLKDGLHLVEALQAREPAGAYRPGTVIVRWGQDVFELSATDSVRD